MNLIIRHFLFVMLLTTLNLSSWGAENPRTLLVIEDAEEHDPASYYDEKPLVLERTGEFRTTQGSRALHFRTVSGSAGLSLINKLHWSQHVDATAMASEGTITFDLWLRNPQDMHNDELGAFMEFTLMSRTNGKRSVWRIGSSLFVAERWNRVTLCIKNGKATLKGSNVNGSPLLSDPDSSVENTGLNWSKLDSHCFGFAHQDVAVEGYLDNVMLMATDEIRPADKVAELQLSDPISHLSQVDTNNLMPRYDIIPPDVRPDAFFTNALINFDTIRGWKATFQGCNGIFCLSRDQAIRGVPNAKVEVNRTVGDLKIVLTPPKPIVISHAFDTIRCWFYTYDHGGVLGLRFRLKDGSPFYWSGGDAPLCGPGLLQYWTIVRDVLAKPIAAGAELVSIDIRPSISEAYLNNKVGTNYLFHLDQLQLSLLTDELRQPPHHFTNMGRLVKIPVRESGSRPSAVEKVHTSLVEKNGRYYFIYASATTNEVRYVYAPQAGTLSDLSIEASGKQTFRPAVESGPLFDFTGAANLQSPELVSKTISDDALLVEWRYGKQPNTETIHYRFSLQGKTLQIEVASTEARLRNWRFGYATGVKSPRVIEVPFMLNSPNVLLADGLFVTYYADWYQSKASGMPSLSENRITNSTVYYNFPDNGLKYERRTDGFRLPVHERLYITASDTFEDVLPNISNPASPNKEVLKERLYKMAAGAPGFIKLTRETVDLYDKYGMDKLYFIFHAPFWSNRGGRGPEPWTGRMKLSVMHDAEGGNAACIDLFKHMAALGIYPGYYDCWQGVEPVSGYWHASWEPQLKPNGNWCPTWVQSYIMKSWAFPELATTVFRPRAEKFGARTFYEDGFSNTGPEDHTDFDARYTNSGTMIDGIRGLATGWQRCRENAQGPVFSEGSGRSFYTAGLNDGDYGKLPDWASGKTPEEKRNDLLVDFQVRKVNPLTGTVGLNFGCLMFGGKGFDENLKYRYELWASQIAFGTIGMLEPYSTEYSDPHTQLPLTLSSYYLMQQLQKRYIMEEVENIRYFDGTNFLSTSDALRNGIYKRNMLRIHYKNGLVVYVNCNWNNDHWLVRDGDKQYDLPRGGWFARQGEDFLEYSAIVDGRRVDFVDCPDFIYVNSGPKEFDGSGYAVAQNQIWIKFKTGSRAGNVVTCPE